MLTGYMQECSIIMQYALFVQHILCCKLIVIFTIIWPWHFFCLKLLHILAFSEIIAVSWGFPWILPWISLNFTLNQFWILAPSVFLWKTLQRFPQNYKYLLNSNYSIEFFQFFNRVFLNFNSFLRVSNPVLYRHSNLRTFSLLISYKFPVFRS